MFAILRRLKESKLRPRHWREITHAAGVTRDKDDDFDILSIWNVDLEMFGAKVGTTSKDPSCYVRWPGGQRDQPYLQRANHRGGLTGNQGAVGGDKIFHQQAKLDRGRGEVLHPG